MRRLALLCIDPLDDEGVVSPTYSARKLQAAVQGSPRVADLEVRVLESHHKDPDEFLRRIEEFDPDMVGYGCYVWSFSTFVDVARQLRRLRPEVVQVFGGPSARRSMFALAPFADARACVDALVEGEGEEALEELLAVAGRRRDRLPDVRGLFLPTADGWHATAPRAGGWPLDRYPSPYWTGLMPRGTAANLETFRGCPMGCAFCQIGPYRKERVFPVEYLTRELRAFRTHDVTTVCLLSSGLNLNAGAFRNLAAAEAASGCLKEHALDCEIYPSRITAEQLEFLRSVRVGRVGIGVQSFDREVLAAVHRPFRERHLFPLVEELAELAQAVCIELILGLPGDSPAAFLERLDQLEDLPCTVRAGHCLILPDALMERAPAGASIRFDPLTLRVQECRGWTPRGIEEARTAIAARAAAAGGIVKENWWDYPTSTLRRRRGQSQEPDRCAPDRGAPEVRASAPSTPAPPPTARRQIPPPPVRAALAQLIEQVTRGRWRLRDVSRTTMVLEIEVETGESSVVVQACLAAPGVRAYRVVEGIAWSYCHPAASSAFVQDFDRLLTVARRLRALVPDGSDAGGEG